MLPQTKSNASRPLMLVSKEYQIPKGNFRTNIFESYVFSCFYSSPQNYLPNQITETGISNLHSTDNSILTFLENGRYI